MPSGIITALSINNPVELLVITLDAVLFLAETYLLIHLKLARDSYFHTPFFHFFFVTGLGGIISVIGSIIVTRFLIMDHLAWIFKLGYMVNSFGVTLATMGKLCIVINRLVVLRNGQLMENIWSRRVTTLLTLFITILAAARCVKFVFCDYTFIVVDGVKFVLYLDDECVVGGAIEKPLTSSIYFIYAIASVILTVMSIGYLNNMSKNTGLATRHLILQQQRRLFIITAACTISHLLKALHQMTWMLVAAFELSSWLSVIRDTYVYPHYLSTYSASIVLVILSPRVRSLLWCTQYCSSRRHDVSIFSY